MKARGNREKGRRGAFLVSLLTSCLFPLPSSAQTPDVRARLDLALSLDFPRTGRQSARLYTPLGRPSTVSLSALLESGLNIVVSERLQRLPGDAEGDIFDEAYVEDPGIWRVGKQYLPFGTGRLIHESAAAARIDSNLIAENLPVTLAGLNAGPGRTNGVLVRVGRGFGASYAYGEHYGISGTSLGVVRRPEDAPGRGGGWRQAFGFDGTKRLGKLAGSAEFVSLSGGPARDLSVLDIELGYFADAYHSFGLGYSHTAGGRDDGFLRLFGRVHAARNLDVEPLLRLKNGGLFDAAVTMRLRL